MDRQHSPIALQERPPEPSGIETRLAEWEAAGLLSRDQAEAIARFERSRPVPVTRRFGRLVTVVSILGIALVGAGVLLTVASNWGAIPDPAKLAVLVAAVAGLEIGGWRLRRADRYPRVGTALVLLGYLLYGAGIHLVAQTYHRPLDDPTLLLLWFLPGLPLAHVLRSGMVLLAAIGVGFGALGMQMAGWFENVDTTAPTVTGLLLATAAALLGAGALLERLPVRAANLGPTYRFAGTAAGLVLLYAGGFKYLYEDGLGGAMPQSAALWFGLAGSVALASAVALIFAGARDRRSIVVDQVALAAAVVLAAVWSFGPDVSPLLAAVVANVVLLAAIVWLVTVGLLERRESLVNLGVAVFAVTLLTRYFEIGMGMLGTGLGFIVSGLVLLGVAFGLERTRRHLLARMAVPEVPDA